MFQRKPSGEWTCLASSESILSVAFAVDGMVYVGTDDAQVLRLNEHGELERIDSFDTVDGRETWYAGTAIIDGKEVGPPLGIRSFSGAAKGRLFANVHVGGIPRSEDGGATWTPTIDVNLDAHEVRVSPYNRDIIAAATAFGLCMSWDGGQSWSVQTEGLHDSYCSAVAVTEDHIFVAASEGHFTQDGAIYRRSTDTSKVRLEKVSAGLPDWLRGIVDTSCIAANENDMALISASGEVFTSNDFGLNWQKKVEIVTGVSSVLIVRQ
ncbi:MAG: hypothetical protein ABJ275_10175 [Maricaulaceae bacterium]